MGWLDRHLAGLAGFRWMRPLVVGVVHGLAGSAAVALLVVAAIPDPAWAVFYLLMFGLGTIVGMTLITAVIAVPIAVAGTGSGRLGSALRISSGIISLAFGLFLVYRIGVIDGLLSVRPAWTPR